MATTIRKVEISSFGDHTHVSIVSALLPAPEPKTVQVKVLYAGMAAADINMRLGIYPMQKKAPLTPGYALVGRVHKNGPGSSKFHVGEIVACLSIYDAQAELANLPEKHLVRVPNGLDLQQAVAVILDWNTAYGMVNRCAKVEKGQRVFIHGLSGGVGYAALKLCQLNGAEVYGTASESNHATLRAAGATPFVYSNKDWMAAMKSMGGAHVVFDGLAFESWEESISILAPEGGHMVGYGWNLNAVGGGQTRSIALTTAKLLARNMLPFRKYRTSFHYIDRTSSHFEPELKACFDLVLQGKIEPMIKQHLTLDEVPEAHRTYGRSKGIGSVVVKIADDIGI